MIYLLLRNDDPGALSDPKKERRVLELFERYHAPQVLAVIPNNVDDPHVASRGAFHPLEENPEVIAILKEYLQKGLIEIAQHGYTHQTSKYRAGISEEITDKSYYNGIGKKWAAYQPAHPEGYSEFNGLSYAEQKDKIVKGQNYLEKIFNVKLQSFIFPWNAYNPTALKILKQQGFRFVPGEEDECVVPGLTIIGACNWDWHIDDFRELLKEMESKKKPVLAHFGYHSWEVSDEMLAKFEDMLKSLSTNPNVKFIMPRQIPQEVPWARWIIPLRYCMLKLERKVNKHLEKEINATKYYVCDYLYYIKRIGKLLVSVIILDLLGLKKTKQLILAGSLGFLVYLFVKLSSVGLLGWFEWAMAGILCGLAAAFMIVRRRVRQA